MPPGSFFGNKSASAAVKTQTEEYEASRLETMLANRSKRPLRADGSDKLLSMMNPGTNVCYANAVLQCLYCIDEFRQAILSYYGPSSPDSIRVLMRDSRDHPPPPAPKPISMIPLSEEARKREQEAIEARKNPKMQEYKKAQARARLLTTIINYDNAKAYNQEPHILTGLRDVFETIVNYESLTGIVQIDRFLELVRKENESFEAGCHQDAHEFLVAVLTSVRDIVDKTQLGDRFAKEGTDIEYSSQPGENFVRDLFRGKAEQQTRCLTCETVSRKELIFYDIDVETEMNTSLASRLRAYSTKHLLSGDDKFQCDVCASLQEAEKTTRIKEHPKYLVIHLKRYKHETGTDNGQWFSRHYKSFESVSYTPQLRLTTTTDDASNMDALYDLQSVVVHSGPNPNSGHYIALVKTSENGWMQFDDESVEPVSEEYVLSHKGRRDHQIGDPLTAFMFVYKEKTLAEVRESINTPPRENMLEERWKIPQAVRDAATRAERDKLKDSTRTGRFGLGRKTSENATASSTKPSNGSTRPLTRTFSAPARAKEDTSRAEDTLGIINEGPSPTSEQPEAVNGISLAPSTNPNTITIPTRNRSHSEATPYSPVEASPNTKRRLLGFGRKNSRRGERSTSYTSPSTSGDAQTPLSPTSDGPSALTTPILPGAGAGATVQASPIASSPGGFTNGITVVRDPNRNPFEIQEHVLHEEDEPEDEGEDTAILGSSVASVKTPTTETKRGFVKKMTSFRGGSKFK